MKRVGAAQAKAIKRIDDDKARRNALLDKLKSAHEMLLKNQMSASKHEEPIYCDGDGWIAIRGAIKSLETEVDIRRLTRLLFIHPSCRNEERLRERLVLSGLDGDAIKRVLESYGELFDCLREIRLMTAGLLGDSFNIQGLEERYDERGEWDWWMPHFSWRRSEEAIELLSKNGLIDLVLGGEKRVLILGGGTGELADAIQEICGGRNRIDIEIIEREERYTLAAKLAGVELINGRPTDLLEDWGQGEESYDCVFFTNESVSSEADAHIARQVDRVLKQGGHFIVTNSKTKVLSVLVNGPEMGIYEPYRAGGFCIQLPQEIEGFESLSAWKDAKERLGKISDGHDFNEHRELLQRLCLRKGEEEFVLRKIGMGARHYGFWPPESPQE